MKGEVRGAGRLGERDRWQGEREKKERGRWLVKERGREIIKERERERDD